jgi:FMN phosphatase YigB (HAD superfamily)
MTNSSIRVVVFDAYGTLFDVYSIGALAEKIYPAKARRCRCCGATSKSSTRD